jgi:DNA helicase-2/ATP-dependent DNA helicase PcrA
VEPGEGVAGEFADLERFLLEPKAPEKPSGLSLGQKVRHFQFGTGLVVGLEDGVATVAFADGVRKLALRYARLEVVG